mmetsp:Transcript_1110/g.2231  ORF Transcript_1110/g.2231 Transcript_1110/m.2231 type:complete len:244 (-) Transcript_1110:114-845(-)
MDALAVMEDLDPLCTEFCSLNLPLGGGLGVCVGYDSYTGPPEDFMCESGVTRVGVQVVDSSTGEITSETACCNTCEWIAGIQYQYVPIGIGCNDGSTDVTYRYTEGLSTTTGSEYGTTNEWSDSVTESASVSASYEGLDASASMSATQSNSVVQTTKTSWTQTQDTSESTTVTIPPDSCYWTLQTTISTVCGLKYGQTGVMETPDKFPPCCFPGLSLDDNDPYGPCLPQNGVEVNLCELTGQL